MQVTNNGATAYQAVQSEVKPGTAAPTSTAVKAEDKSGGSAVPAQQDTVTLSSEALALSGGATTQGGTLPPWPDKTQASATTQGGTLPPWPTTEA